MKRIGYKELCLHSDELDFLTELVSFLKPFEEFTDLCSCSLPSLSLLPVMKARIKKNCLVNENDHENMKAIKTAILSNVDKRFPDSDNVKLQQVLDPKTKAFVDKHEATVLLEHAFKLAHKRDMIVLKQSNNIASATDLEDEDPVSKKRRLRSIMVNELRAQAEASTANDGDYVGLAVEIAHYLSSRFDASVYDSVLKFWQCNALLFPHLSQLAHIHLSASSTSVPVESMFSITGLIVNSRRSRLNAEKLHKICFIHDNHKFAF